MAASAGVREHPASRGQAAWTCSPRANPSSDAVSIIIMPMALKDQGQDDVFMFVAEEAQAERLGRAIMSLRAARGMKRKDLAVAARLAYPYLAELENGAKTPLARALQSIAGALQLSPAELLGHAEAMPDLEAPRRPVGADENRQLPASTVLPGTWTEARPGAGAEDAADLVSLVVRRVTALIEEDLRKRLEHDLPALVREELDRSRGGRP